MRGFILLALPLIAAGCALPVGGRALAPTVSDVPPPTPDDFVIAVNIIEKNCFGSYGCNVRFKIMPVYNGPHQPDDNRFTVVYAVMGCEDEKQASFEMGGGKWNPGVLDWDYCTTSTGQLTAHVIRVLS